MQLPMDLDGVTLRTWAALARPGDRRIYHLGYLAGSESGAKLAAVARELERSGAVTLFQKRIDEGVYAYIAQRRADAATCEQS